MQMKKAIVISMLAATMGATAVSPVMAQSTSKSVHTIQIGKTSFLVNGTATDIRTIIEAGSVFASVRDLATAVGATVEFDNGKSIITLDDLVVEVTPNSNVLVVNEEEKALTKPVMSVQGSNFVEPAAFIAALGAIYTGEGANASITTVQLLADAETVQWINATTLLVSKTTEAGREDYIVDVATGKYEVLLSSEGASDLTVTVDGTKAAYSDADGYVYVIDVATKKATKVSEDASIKSELTWAADASAIYFLQGDKTTGIAKVTLADGKVTVVIDDKVEYKEGLSVSKDGAKFAYTVYKPAKAVADATKPVDSDDVAIDDKGSEPQVYIFDTTIKGGKPVQLTTDTQDKASLTVNEDGTKAYYISIGTDEAAQGKFVNVNPINKSVYEVYAGNDVFQAVKAGNKYYLLTASNETSNMIIEIDAVTGAKKLVKGVSAEVSEILVSAEGQLAIVEAGKVQVLVEGNWKAVTK